MGVALPILVFLATRRHTHPVSPPGTDWEPDSCRVGCWDFSVSGPACVLWQRGQGRAGIGRGAIAAPIGLALMCRGHATVLDARQPDRCALRDCDRMAMRRILALSGQLRRAGRSRA